MKEINKIALLLLLFLCFAFQSISQKIPVWTLGDLEAAVHKSKGPTVINFWATFCKPCIEEMPHFQALAEKYKNQGLSMILVSLDLKEAYPTKIAALIKKMKIFTPVSFLEETDADLFCPVVDKSWSGVIPATIFLHSQNRYKKFFEEELTKEALEKEILLLLDSVK